MKKKIAILAIVLAVSLGSVQVYAATVLNTSLIDLIKNGFSSIKAYYTTKVETDTNSLNEKFTNETTEVVSGITEDALNELQNHKNNEIIRSEQELDAYLKAVEEELNSLANQQVADIKGSITENVNKSIQKTKEQIAKEIEKQINGKLKIQ